MRREPLPWTERLRRKIWGTDGPPGQPDPDVRLEPEEVERLEQAQEARQKRRRKQAVAALPGPRPVPGADGYQPATTWHGLGRVGTLPIDEARRKQPFQSWVLRSGEMRDKGEADGLSSFLLEVPLTEPRLLTAALQTAVMDVLHLRRGGLVRTESVQHAALEAAPSQDAQSASDPKARVPRVELDPALAAISLEDLNTKFAVMREVMRLTGRRIPDPVIARIEHVGGLHEYLLTPAKPKTVADALVAHEALTALPNVTIHTRRVTPIDREKVVGRWKVIERELEARGLPVTGRG
ncbi:MAG: hypothetical protein M1826_001839 [Phylliscum demangeonii]|nr:MAG: hypothetical protein M1826_001839 [Phylliscum demangeonii]